ncbi:MAG: tRNA 2-thiocytidine(32) synthetase TtcA [Gammaproteobacteria bacterium]|nr:tRNA 2-thiocytidine(32) synthetase TtcA [Gammaproteobacteria bacterium]
MSSRVEKKLRHYTGRCIADYNMIQKGDRVLVCVSGGKDSYTLLKILHQLRLRSGRKFELQALTLDQAQPGWDDSVLHEWMDNHGFPYEVIRKDTYAIVKDKIPEGKTYCSLCSRLRRGVIYSYAKENGFNKIALGHHRDDLIESLLMSTLYSGEIRSMPPKLLTQDKRHIVIRPMAYCQEADIIRYAKEEEFPIIPCNLCGSQEKLTRKKVKQLIADLAADNPKVPANMLHALGSVRKSQLMDQDLWNFKDLEKEMIASGDASDIDPGPLGVEGLDDLPAPRKPDYEVITPVSITKSRAYQVS